MSGAQINGVRGQCRRHAPMVHKNEDGHLKTAWPIVSEDAFCGEHAEWDDEA
jgi:hypothetical protein